MGLFAYYFKFPPSEMWEFDGYDFIFWHEHLLEAVRREHEKRY